jgi:MoaA/NifB/PqqE/SkfB family radical SAM enzyme
MNPIKIVSTKKSNILEIVWTPNNVCNYKCEYCWPENNSGDYLSPTDLGLIVKNFNHLLERYKTKLGKDKVHLKIGGGEPSLWKDLALFIKEIKKENDVYLTLISNGSRTLRWWKEYGELIDNAHLSYHISQADPDHMIAVADTIYEFNKKVTVKVLMDRKHWQEGLDVIEYMKKNSKHKWFIMTSEVIEPEISKIGNIKVVNADDIQITKNQKKFLKNPLKRIPNLFWIWKNRKLLFEGQIRLYESVAHFEDGKSMKAKTNAYINNNWNNFEGWSCDIGLEHFFIQWDGSIIGSCQQTLYGLDYSFNILDENFVEKFDPEFKPAVCSKKNCFCVPETHVSKFKLS